MICLLGRLKSRIPSITIDRFCADQLANAVLTLPEAELATLFQVLRLFVQETTFTESEWPLVSAILPPESLAKMARVNYQNLESSLRSAEVRSRIHCLALICCYLSGSYSKTGIAKWFQRKRPKLGDKTPEELLSLEYYAWLKESAKVRDLALGLNQ
jgi:hypothetical protein